MVLLDRQVYRAPYLLTSFPLSFTRNKPNTPTAQYVNGGSSLILSLGKFDIFLSLKPSSQPFAPNTLQDDTSDQKPEKFIWFIVMSQSP